MNQSFLDRQKYNLPQRKIQKKKFKLLQKFFGSKIAPHPLFWAYLVITFVPKHQLWKKYIPTKLISFPIFKKVSKKYNKFSTLRYLHKNTFVPQRDNGPLGVKIFQLTTLNTRWHFGCNSSQCTPCISNDIN